MHEGKTVADLSPREKAGYAVGALVRAKLNTFQTTGLGSSMEMPSFWRTAKIAQIIGFDSDTEPDMVLLEGCVNPTRAYDTYLWNADSRALRLAAARDFAGRLVSGWVKGFFTDEEKGGVGDINVEAFDEWTMRQADDFVLAALYADYDVLR